MVNRTSGGRADSKGFSGPEKQIPSGNDRKKGKSIMHLLHVFGSLGNRERSLYLIVRGRRLFLGNLCCGLQRSRGVSEFLFGRLVRL